MSSREYKVVLTQQVSQGRDRDEALTMIGEAIELYRESLEAHGDPIPAPIEVERVTVSA